MKQSVLGGAMAMMAAMMGNTLERAVANAFSPLRPRAGKHSQGLNDKWRAENPGVPLHMKSYQRRYGRNGGVSRAKRPFEGING